MSPDTLPSTASFDPFKSGDERRPVERTTLKDALADSDLMLAYAAHRGIDIDKDVVTKLVAAIEAGRVGCLTEQQELDFWLAHTTLSKVIRPVDSDSLRCAVSEGPMSLADAAARRYRFKTIITLVLLLVFQIYWLIGATVVADIDEIEKTMNPLAPVYAKAYYAWQEAESAVPRAIESGAAQQEVDKLRSNAAALVLTREEAWAPLNVEQIKAKADFDVLTAWNTPNPLRWWVGTLKPAAGPPTSRVFAPNNDAAKEEPDLSNEEKTPFYLWVFTPETVKQTQTAKIALATLLKYILPILYGALGASAFIVRSLADRIKAITYTAESDVGYELRFYLGAVAGLSVAWFTAGEKGADTAGILQSLSPLAIAFVAGFSVELLFSMLERVVAAFSVPTTNAPADSAAASRTINNRE